MAGRRPVPGAHAALQDVRQRAAEHARGLHREDHGVLDLHLSGAAPQPLAGLAARAGRYALHVSIFKSKISFRLSYEICYEDLTLLQVSLFDFSTDESENDFVLAL